MSSEIKVKFIFRSLNLEQDNLNNLNKSDRVNEQSGLYWIKYSNKIFFFVKLINILIVQTLSVSQALFIPAAASVSLILMFYFFESIQTIFLICTASKFLLFSLVINR